jgi:hypothetical protein
MNVADVETAHPDGQLPCHSVDGFGHYQYPDTSHASFQLPDWPAVFATVLIDEVFDIVEPLALHGDL